MQSYNETETFSRLICICETKVTVREYHMWCERNNDLSYEIRIERIGVFGQYQTKNIKTFRDNTTIFLQLHKKSFVSFVVCLVIWEKVNHIHFLFKHFKLQDVWGTFDGYIIVK